MYLRERLIYKDRETTCYRCPNKVENPIVSERTRAATILYVDDCEPILASRRAYLGNHGYEVLTATTGATALTRMQEGNVSLAVMDYELPDITGVELARKFKTIRPSVPLILLSGTVAEDLKIPSGLFNRVLLKGSRPGELMEVLRELLECDSREV